MEKAIEDAIETLAKQIIKDGAKSGEAMQLSQACLNLAHARAQLIMHNK